MRKVIAGIFLWSSMVSWAQFDAQISQYMFHGNAFNPAAAGENNMIDIVGHHRIHMLGMPGGGSTTLFSVSSPISLLGKKHGIGINLTNDQVGWFTNKSANLQFAFKRQLANGRLSLGVSTGFVSIGFTGDSVAQHNITLGDYHSIVGDEHIPQTSIAGTGFDLNVGAFYTHKNWYAGTSIVHLNQPIIKWGQRTSFKQEMLFYTTAGYNLQLSNPKLQFKPSVLVKSNFKNLQLDLSAYLLYDTRFWGGLTVRPLNSIVLFTGLNFGSGFALGYAFDLATNRLITTNWGSHEFCLSYSFEFVSEKSTTKHKSIRYL